VNAAGGNRTFRRDAVTASGCVIIRLDFAM
jgi:hypothetical protein